MKSWGLFRRTSTAVVIGLAVGYLRVQIAHWVHNGAGDFYYSMRIIRDLWQGRNPFAYPAEPDLVSYPLTAGLLSAPFAVFPDELAGGLFIGASSALLAWYLLENGRSWPLLIYLSWPMAYAVLFVQYSPLITCIWFAPSLLPLILIKPQSVLPLVLTNRISKRGLVLGIVFLVFSLIIYPAWPLAWFKTLGPYTGAIPVFSLPLGPIILLALLKYRDRRAWLLVLMALMPQRVIYDQLPLLLIAGSFIELVFLTICSWLALPVLLSSGGWIHMPVNWQFWIILTLYLPALLVLIRPDLQKLLKRFFHRLQT